VVSAITALCGKSKTVFNEDAPMFMSSATAWATS